jgi:hypothetical protein
MKSPEQTPTTVANARLSKCKMQTALIEGVLIAVGKVRCANGNELNI